MNNSNVSGSANGQHNASSSPSMIDIEHLENRPELPHAERHNTRTLQAPGPGGSGHVASLPTFTTADAAGTVAFTNPVAAPPPEPTNGAGAAETSTSGQTDPVTIDGPASDPDVDLALATREEQRDLEEYVRDMNTRGLEALPPDAAIVTPFAAPPFGVGLFAPAVTVDTTAELVTVAATAPAVNGGVAASSAAASATAPTAPPAPSPTDPGHAGHGRRHSHGGAAFDEHGQIRFRADGTSDLEHTPPSTLGSDGSPPPTQPAATNPIAPLAAYSPRPLGISSLPSIAASPPPPPTVDTTPRTPTPAASTGNTPEPEDPEHAEFFDVDAASE